MNVNQDTRLLDVRGGLPGAPNPNPHPTSLSTPSPTHPSAPSTSSDLWTAQFSVSRQINGSLSQRRKQLPHASRRSCKSTTKSPEIHVTSQGAAGPSPAHTDTQSADPMACGVKGGAETSEAKRVDCRRFTLMDFISHSAESHGD